MHLKSPKIVQILVINNPKNTEDPLTIITHEEDNQQSSIVYPHPSKLSVAEVNTELVVSLKNFRSRTSPHKNIRIYKTEKMCAYVHARD